MARAYNFSAGPSMLPEWVLQRAAKELIEYPGTGQSVMEMSHRAKEYETIHYGCEALLRKTMNVPDNYKILFLMGGAHTQFAMVPLNLLKKSADYVLTGQWAQKAYQEGSRFGKCNVIADTKDKNYTYEPKLNPSAFTKDADYFHVCYNNTIFGTRFTKAPETGSVPLVADMSSFILSEPVDVSKFGIIYACAQKNMGPAGVTAVIIREDLIGHAREGTPTMLDYKTHADTDSLYNTPPCYNIYVMKLVLEWINDVMGGLDKVKVYNEKKAKVLYDYLDGSKMFKATINGPERSLMNVTYVTGSEELDNKFIKEATAAGFLNLKGYRTVGGMRASIYNGMPMEGVEKLVQFMGEFEKKN